MVRLKGQASPDYIFSIFLFSVVFLYIFITFYSNYYSKSWEFYRSLADIRAQRIANLMLLKGNWSYYPFYSSAPLPGTGYSINESLLRLLVGMPYQHVQNKLGFANDFYVKVEKMPSIAIVTDLEEQINATGTYVNVSFKAWTSESCNLTAILYGETSITTTEGKYIWRSWRSEEESNSFSIKFEKVYPGIYQILILCWNEKTYGSEVERIYVG